MSGKDFGVVDPGSTLYIEFDSFGANGESITLTGLAATDIEVYKDGGTTQRGSDAGYTLLDTDGIDFDGVTGIHGLSIDLADNTTAGFWAAGSHYRVVIASVTINAQTVTFTAATFRIGYKAAVLNTTIATLASQTSFTLTAGPAEDDALNGCVVLIHDVASAVQKGFAVVSDYTGSTKTVTLTAGTTFTAAATDNISFFPPVNAGWGGAVAYSTTRGLSGTALPNAAADAAGGLPISDAGGLDLDAQIGTKITGIYSDTTIIYSDTTIIYSDTTIATSKTTQIYSDTTIIYSDTTIATSKTTQIYSDTTIIYSDTTLISSDAARCESKAVQIYSDTTIVVSDTTHIDSDTTHIESDAARIESKAVQIYSDTTIIYSDTTLISSDAARCESKAVQIYSDTTAVHSDTTAIHLQTTTIASDLVIVASDLLQVYSDTTIIASDVALLETTRAEPGQGAPAATASPLTKVDYLYKAWRNKKTQDATTFELYDDAGTTVDQKATVSDDGTDFTFGEIATGP